MCYCNYCTKDIFHIAYLPFPCLKGPGLTFFRGEQSNSTKDLSTRSCAVATEYLIVLVEAATLSLPLLKYFMHTCRPGETL